MSFTGILGVTHGGIFIAYNRGIGITSLCQLLNCKPFRMPLNCSSLAVQQ
jgi:anaerobic C4-dicarboxylate transporter